MIRVAINGFGRIGRNALRAGWGQKGIQFVAINDLTDPKILAYLLKYDTVYGTWDRDVKATDTHLIIGGRKIPVSSEKDPSQIAWRDNDVDVVIESTGFFTDNASARGHLRAGARSVLISAPSKDVPTHLMGVNHDKINGKKGVYCMASCTTNSSGVVVAIMREAFGVQKAMLSTIHSVTSGQNVVDSVPNKRKPDLRRARSILGNIIPTSTGAAKATARTIPAMKDKFDGVSIRVPVLDVSLSDFTFLTRKKVSVKDVNKAFKKATRSARWKKVLGVTEDPVVSSDMIGSPYGAIIDLGMTRVVDGDLVKVMAWYDNEWGYSIQLIDMIREVAKRTSKKR